MLLKKSYNQNQLRDYSSLFSRNTALAWLRNDFSSINYKIQRYNPSWFGTDNKSYVDYLEYIYDVLEKNYQNEYILKNTFLTELLIKEVGQQNTKVFSEYRVGDAIADLVMFNGTSKAFEIKTNYDNENRLALQLENYRKAFNEIYLIIPETKLKVYKKYDHSIGLITFNLNERSKFTFEREAKEKIKVDFKTIMNILHSHEYKAIVQIYYRYLPKMDSFNQFEMCSKLIEKIPNKELNRLFIEQMKNRKFENVLSKKKYKEFNQLSIALKLNKKQKDNLIRNLKNPIEA